MSSRQELEAAAADVIKILKGIDEFKEASIAVIGGLALWKYIPYGRTTEVCAAQLESIPEKADHGYQDVDFIINCANAPDGVKQKLLRLPDSPFVQYAELFYYKNPRGQQIQIDITPHSQVSRTLEISCHQKKHEEHSLRFIAVAVHASKRRESQEHTRPDSSLHLRH